MRALPGLVPCPARSPRRRNAPSREMQSKLVAVPKSTTMAGVPYRRATARPFDEPVRSHLSRARYPDRHRHVAGAGHHQRHPAALGHGRRGARQSRHHRRERDAGDVGQRSAVEAEQVVDQHLELVGRARGSGRRPPGGNDRLPGHKAEGQIGVADVEGEQHGPMIARLRARTRRVPARLPHESAVVRAPRTRQAPPRPTLVVSLVPAGAAEVRSTGPSPASPIVTPAAPGGVVSSVPPAKFFVNRGIVSSRTDLLNVLRPLEKQTVAYRYYRGHELVQHGLGWVERIVANEPETSTFFTPLSICLNVEFVRASRVRDPSRPAAHVSSGSGGRGRRDRFRAWRSSGGRRVRAAAARVRHVRLRPDGVARPRSHRGRVGVPDRTMP